MARQQPTRYRHTRHLRVLAVAGSLSIMLAACGGDDGDDQTEQDDGAQEEEAQDEPAEEDEEEAAQEPVTVSVGVIPIADVAPLYLGIDQGFFEEENLTVETQEFAGGAEILPAVQSGDLQFGFSNTTSLLIAASEGLPVRIISQGVQEAEDEADSWSHIWVREDSDIEEPQDLEGRTISLNTLQNITEVTARYSLEQLGVDNSQLNFVEVPFPEANQALDQGDVDAIYVVEPFDTVARQSDARPIVAPLHATEPSLTVGTYFATQDYIDENEDVTERFVNAMHRSLEYADENPDAVRDTLGSYTQIPEELIGEVRLAQWSTDLNQPSIELMGELSAQYGLIEEAPSVEEMIWTPGS